MKFLKIDPTVKLSSVPIFKVVAILLPLLSSACILIIVLNSNLTFDFSYEGFNFALFTVFRVPLALLAAGVTILGVIAAIHRSSQTMLQIEKSTEQNTFSNFYRHRQEYVEHFKELSKDFPDHIKDNISEKIIRGYYYSTYPENSPTNFTVKPRIGWIETFDEGLIELSYILIKMNNNENVNIILLLYKEFLRQEVSIRQGLFEINKPENAEISLIDSKSTIVRFWNGRNIKVTFCEKLVTSCFTRIREYSDFITKLKYFVDEFEGTMLYGTDVYSGLSSLEYHNKLDQDEYPIKRLYLSGSDTPEITEAENKELTEIFNDIRSSYDKKIKELRAIREYNSQKE